MSQFSQTVLTGRLRGASIGAAPLGRGSGMSPAPMVGTGRAALILGVCSSADEKLQDSLMNVHS